MIMHFHGSGGQGSNSCPHNWCDISDEDADGGFIVVGVSGVVPIKVITLVIGYCDYLGTVQCA